MLVFTKFIQSKYVFLLQLNYLKTLYLKMLSLRMHNCLWFHTDVTLAVVFVMGSILDLTTSNQLLEYLGRLPKSS